MTTRVLVPIDLNHKSGNDKILGYATMAANHDGAELTLLTVIESAPALVSQYLAEGYEHLAANRVESDLQELANTVDSGQGEVSCEVRFGSVYREILAYAERIGANLIVMGSHEPDAADYLIGSNATRVVRHAKCSVFVVRGEGDSD